MSKAILVTKISLRRSKIKRYLTNRPTETIISADPLTFCNEGTKTYFDNLLFEMNYFMGIDMAWDGIIYDQEIEFEEMLVVHSSHYIEACGCPGDKLLYKDSRKEIFTKIIEGNGKGR